MILSLLYKGHVIGTMRQVAPTPTLGAIRLRYCAWDAQQRDLEFWPCLPCSAKGWIYDPSEKPCPVEGYKMVSRLNCPLCKGSGRGDKAAVEAVYRLEKNRHAIWRKAQTEKLAALKTVLAKLDWEEVLLLKETLGRFESAPHDAPKRNIHLVR